jgi:hypothetical protein
VPDRSLSAPTSSTPEHSAHRARLIVESCIETELCAALDDIAVSNFDPATRPYGGGDDVIVGGYRRLVDALAFAADIRPNSEVQRVVQRGTTVTAGLSDRTEFVSAGAIITVPLGVLKASSITFEPALPPLFTAAIGQLGFGRFEKVFLQFDHRSSIVDRQRRAERSLPTRRRRVPLLARHQYDQRHANPRRAHRLGRVAAGQVKPRQAGTCPPSWNMDVLDGDGRLREPYITEPFLTVPGWPPRVDPTSVNRAPVCTRTTSTMAG